ncbi:DUF3948 domain-containing protein [Bacillus thuringiensis LM1212]|nr:DUF3948 domain-containing protein [Bacillus thuringiensis LM1212]QDF25693.1 DUF3948 family protein [Bacillus tropicus]QUG93632.1 DUF3948 family protein [Bacillus tropicus]
MKEQVLQVTKGDFVGSASGAVVLTALIVFCNYSATLHRMATQIHATNRAAP